MEDDTPSRRCTTGTTIRLFWPRDWQALEENAWLTSATRKLFGNVQKYLSQI